MGSDLFAKAIEGDDSVLGVRVEAKGLSGHDPWATHLTRNQREEALNDERSRTEGWRLVIVTNALNARRKQYWLSSEEAARVFCVPERSGSVFSANRTIAATLCLGRTRPAIAESPPFCGGRDAGGRGV